MTPELEKVAKHLISSQRYPEQVIKSRWRAWPKPNYKTQAKILKQHSLRRFPDMTFRRPIEELSSRLDDLIQFGIRDYRKRGFR